MFVLLKKVIIGFCFRNLPTKFSSYCFHVRMEYCMKEADSWTFQWPTSFNSQSQADMEERTTSRSCYNGLGAMRGRFSHHALDESCVEEFVEENFMSNKTHENLIGSVEHPVSRVCSVFAAVKNAVGIALLSRIGYAGILCVANDLSKTAHGIENNKDVTFQISIPADEKRCHESWHTVLSKLWDRKVGGYSETDKFIKSMRFMIKNLSLYR